MTVYAPCRFFPGEGQKGFTLVEVLVVIGIIALLAAIAIPNLVRAKVSANESSAQATLKSIATALENYATLNSVYPSATTALLGAAPPYLNTDYFIGVHNGYSFTTVLADYYYTVTATPVNNTSGTKTYTISTGGVLQ